MCETGRRIQRICELSLHLDIQHFAGFAFGKNFKWPATDFAIGGKTLSRNARVDDEVEVLAAKRALDGFSDFHVVIRLYNSKMS